MAKKKDNNSVFKTAIVEKRNVLNEIRKNSMSTQELRFFSIYLSKINARDPSTRVVRFPLEDFRKIMEIGEDMNMNHFRNTFHRLLQQIVDVPNENGYGFSSFQLFKRCKLYKNEYNEWYVEIDAHDDALPLMFEFKKNYFTYELWNALRLGSVNQIRMYEILKQYEHIGKREISVTELRDLLGITPNEHTRWDNFKRVVLDGCQKALAESTDICFTYEKGKSGPGGKWLTIVFHITKNEDYVDQLTLDDFIERQPKVTADEEDDPHSRYSNEMFAGLADSCDFEFDDDAIKLIFDVIKDKSLQSDCYDKPGSVAFAREKYLRTMYNRLNYADKQGQIKSRKTDRRLNYLLGMLKNDVHDD